VDEREEKDQSVKRDATRVSNGTPECSKRERRVD
jgi:hypothetical protein